MSLLLLLGIAASCSESSQFNQSLMNLGKKQDILGNDDASGQQSSAKQPGPSQTASKGKDAFYDNETEKEKPSVEVSGVNLVPDCVSVSASNAAVASNGNTEAANESVQVNCAIEISRPARVVFVQPRLEGKSTNGRTFSLLESRETVSTPASTRKIDLVFVAQSNDPAAIETLKNGANMTLQFQRIIVDDRASETVSTPVSVQTFLKSPTACPEESKLVWTQHTLTWDPRTQVKDTGGRGSSNVRMITQRISTTLSGLPEPKTHVLCGARFVGVLNKNYRADDDANTGFYSDRLLLLLGSTVLASDDLWQPLRMSQPPALLRLYDTRLLFGTPLTAISSSQPSRAFTSLGPVNPTLFSDLTDERNPEYQTFNPSLISPRYLRQVLENMIKEGVPLNFGLHAFGTGSSSDGFNTDLTSLEATLELSFKEIR